MDHQHTFSSGHGTELNLPFSWSQTSGEDYKCCSLLDPTWRFTPATDTSPLDTPPAAESTETHRTHQQVPFSTLLLTSYLLSDKTKPGPTFHVQATEPEDGQLHNSDATTDLDPTWRFTPSLNTRFLEKPPTIDANVKHWKHETKPFPLSSRDYSSLEHTSPVVTFNLEQIEPQDGPPHPCDNHTQRRCSRKPWGIATNSHTQQIYVSDRGLHVIMVFGPDGDFQRTIGEAGEEPGKLCRPTGIAYDAVHQRIVVADKGNHRIQTFCAATGRFLFTFGSRGKEAGEFSFPWGVAVSPDGSHIAVTDSRNKRIQLFTSDGTFLRLRNIGGQDWLNHTPVKPYPRAIAFNRTGTYLYYTDFNLNKVMGLHISLVCKPCTIADHHLPLRRPSGVAVDHQGNLIVCDTGNNCIRVFSSNKQLIRTVEQIGGYEIDFLQDISVMSSGHLAMLELEGRVRIV